MIEKFIKPSVLALSPYSSARDEYFGQEGIFLDANENPFDFQYSRYPDPYQRELKSVIAQWRRVKEEQLFLGNGSDEIIDLLVRTTCSNNEHRILSLDPSYGMYKVTAAINDIPIDLVPMKKDLSVDEEALYEILNDSHRLIFICSPNNPNGSIVHDDLVFQLLEKSNALVIVDEAYIDFSDQQSWLNKLKENPNLIVLQTFSKAMGGAGLRLGMGFMNERLVRILNKVKPPYNISSPAQEKALELLRQMNKIERGIAEIKSERKSMIDFCKELSNVRNVFPSQSNFILVRFHNHASVFEGLRQAKIIVRDRSSQTHCDNSIRFTIGTKKENEIVKQQLKKLENINSKAR